MNGESFTVDHPEALVYRGGLAVYVDQKGVPSIFDHESVTRFIGIEAADHQDLGIDQRGIEPGGVLAVADGDPPGEAGDPPDALSEQRRRDVIDLGVAAVVLDMNAQPRGSPPLDHGLSPGWRNERHFWHQTGDA